MAVLIDADNAQPSIIEDLLSEIAKYGTASVKRIYGDWTTPGLRGWKEVLLQFSIQPIQQFRYTVGKNATDSAMIIDAMDILHSEEVSGFCLVSSDSDYTRLATRLRESGAFVMGIGKAATPKAFSRACDLFVFVENLEPSSKKVRVAADQKESSPAKPNVNDALPWLKKAFDLSVKEDGWAYLGGIGSSLRSLDPSFDHRTFGCSSLRALVASFPKLIELREAKGSPGNTIVSMRFK